MADPRCSVSGKKMYKQSEQASKVRDIIFNRSGVVKRIYVCPDCGQHHLTSHVTPEFEREFNRKHRR